MGRKTIYTLSGILILVLAIRAFAPGFILRKLNETLATISPLYTAHVDDLDIALWRMAYSFEGIEVRQRKPERAIVNVKDVDISLAWRELLRFHIVVDVDVREADVKVDEEVLALMKSASAPKKEDKVADGDVETPAEIKDAKDSAKAAKKKLIPFNVERVRIFDSRIVVRDLPQLPIEQALRVTNIDATLRNLVPSERDPQTDFAASANVMNSAKLRAEGDAQLLAKDLTWDLEAELSNLDVRAANSILSRMLPLTFDKGSLDAYARVQAKGDKIKGSVQPFAKDLEFIGDKRDFKGIKHGFIEVASAIGSWFLENRKQGTVATQIDFDNSSGEFKVDTSKAIDLALRHRFKEPLKQKHME